MAEYKTLQLMVILFSTFSVTKTAKVLYNINHNEFRHSNENELTPNLNNFMKINHPDMHLSAIGLINKYGYNGEAHWVTTSDGYILELHRITGRKENPSPDGKPPVLLVHGLLCSSVDWIITGPKNAFGYLLADVGYDVWLGNVRGNKYSRNHTNISINSIKFWKFSWHEMGIYDLPAMIDYILMKTNHRKLFYVAHSQGTTIFYVMTSEVPEYNDKIATMFALAPVAYLSNMISPVFRILAKIIKYIIYVMHVLGQYEFNPTNSLMRFIKSTMCHDGSILQPICTNVIFMICGYTANQINITELPIILNHVPAGASIQQFSHYAQLVKSGKFEKYDYGIKNKIIYGTVTPPTYNITKITVPIVLFYSKNDWLSQPKDVNKLYIQLYRFIGKFPIHNFNHLDFLWGINAKELVYEKIIRLMSLHTIKGF